MKIKPVIVCSIIALFLSGCGLLTPPDDVIGPPKPDINISSDNNDVESIIAGFLPSGASLMSVKYGNDVKTAAFEDVDGDGTEEIVLIYKGTAMYGDTMVMILKKGQKTWEKLYDKSTLSSNASGGAIKNIDFKDITGDGAPEIFILREQSLEVYITVTNINGQLVVGAFQFGNKNTFEAQDIPGVDGSDGIAELIVKSDLPRNQPDTVVMRWTGFSLADVTGEYPWYLKDEVDYLNDQVSNKGMLSKLRELEFAQEKAGMYEDALKTCDKMVKLSDEGLAKNIKTMRADLLLKLGRYDEAVNAYRSIGLDDASLGLKTAMVYEAKGEYDMAREIYKSMSQFPYDENIQRLDAIDGETKIYNFIKSLGPGGMKKAAYNIKSWGMDNSMVISSAEAEENADAVEELVVVDYYIDPSKAYGKKNIGGHMIYWWEGEKLFYQGYLTVTSIPWPLNSSFNEVVNEGMDTAFAVAEAGIYQEGNDTVLKAVYRDETKGRTVDRVYRLRNMKWKLSSK